jgi:hypothetical protein
MSIFDILPWWTWLFGSLGVGGAIALAVLAPAAAAAAEQTLAAVVGRLLQTRIGVGLIVGAIALFLGWVGGALHVENICDGRLESQRLMAEAAGKKRDADIAGQIAWKYSPVLKQLEASAETMKQEAARYVPEKPVPLAAGGGCQLGAAALRLRNERAAGAAAGQPRRPGNLRADPAAAAAAGHPADR